MVDITLGTIQNTVFKKTAPDIIKSGPLPYSIVRELYSSMCWHIIPLSMSWHSKVIEWELPYLFSINHDLKYRPTPYGEYLHLNIKGMLREPKKIMKHFTKHY